MNRKPTAADLRTMVDNLTGSVEQQAARIAALELQLAAAQERADKAEAHAKSIAEHAAIENARAAKVAREGAIREGMERARSIVIDGGWRDAAVAIDGAIDDLPADAVTLTREERLDVVAIVLLGYETTNPGMLAHARRVAGELADGQTPYGEKAKAAALVARALRLIPAKEPA